MDIEVADAMRVSSSGDTRSAVTGKINGTTEIPDAAAAARHITEHCLTDGPVGRVGLEIEAHCFDPVDPRRRPRWTEIGDVLAGLPGMPGGSAVTVEPGGAVELSTPPLDGVLAAIAAMAADRVVLAEAFAAAGLGLVAMGTDPLRPSRRINPGDRYRAMEHFFTATSTGTAGAAMMTATASIQVNLDAGPRIGWGKRIRLAHALGPTMVAMSASSPLLAGELTGWRSTRQRIWSELDAARCGPVLGAGGSGPADDWAHYALAAPVMLVHTPQAVPLTRRVPFADWADGREPLNDRQPTVDDLAYHLTTLFPPVRPRGWLEIRYLDSLEATLWPAMVFTLATLLDDPVAADLAAEAVEPVATAWDLGARVGLADPQIKSAARRCLRIATDRLPPHCPNLIAAMSRLTALVEQGRCPGDDLTDLVRAGGLAPTVARLAGGQS